MTKTCGNCGWFKRGNSTTASPPPIQGKCRWTDGAGPLPYWMQKDCLVMTAWGENCLVWKPGEVEGATEATPTEGKGACEPEEELLKLYYVIERGPPVQPAFPKYEVRPMPVVPDSGHTVVETHLPFPEADHKCKALEEKRKKR